MSRPFQSNTNFNVHTGDVQQGRNPSSFALSSAVSVGLHLPALCTQTCEAGVLAGGNGQPSMDQLDIHVYELF